VREEKEEEEGARRPQVRFAVSFGFFLVILALGAGVVAAPMVRPIAWSGLLAFLSAPLFDRLSRLFRGRWQNLAAFLTLLLLIGLFFVPMLFLSVELGNDMGGLYRFGSNMAAALGTEGAPNLARYLPPRLEGWIAPFLADREMIRSALANVTGWVAGAMANLSKGLLSSAATFSLEAAITVILSFFFIRDGRRIAGRIREAIPLPPEERDPFVDRMQSTLKAVVFGVLLTVVGWHLTGLPNPLFYGALMFLMGMIPVVGTASVWVPGAIYLFLTGHPREGAFLLAWGVLVVGMVDNLVRPWLMSGEGGVSPPVALVGILGGLASFGFLGIFLGPLLLALFFAAFDIHLRRNDAPACPPEELPSCTGSSSSTTP
jgi:predicted PurR-regulated permease PerM